MILNVMDLDKLKFITWYGANLQIVAIPFLIVIGASWQFYFKPIGQEEWTWAVIVLMAIIYYGLKRYVRKYCHGLIIGRSVSFKEMPRIGGPTSEHLMDSFDKRILHTVNNLHDYLQVIPELSDIMSEKDVIFRLAKLRSLGLVRALPSRVTLTPEGLEAMTTPSLATKAIVPARFSSTLARARIMLDEGNFNGVVDMINILFEDILKAVIEEKLGEKLASTWKDLLKKGHVNRPFNRAGLGVLLTACRHMGIISQGSIQDSLLSTFLKLRVPEKHLTKIKSDPEKDARSSLDLAQIFVRYWFIR